MMVINCLFNLQSNITIKMNNHPNHTSYSPDSHYRPKDDPLAKLRNTVMKLEERTSDFYLLRNSFSTQHLRHTNLTTHSQFRTSDASNNKKKTFLTLKNTLDMLENKINLTKEELQIPTTSMAKKNKVYVHIDERIEREEHSNHRSTDSSITQKIGQKKLNSIKTSMPRPKNVKSFNINPYSPRRHSIYYISQAIRAINEKNSLALDHVNASIKMIKACEAYEIPHISEVQARKVNLKKYQPFKNKKSLILDLDQTLIHCVENIEAETDLKIKLKVQDVPIEVGINIRPYALTFLRKMAQKFQIIIFTASHQTYADAILDQLDPQQQIFQHRLYRQHCHVLTNQLHVKDLRILNRNPSEMVLVDNAAYSYAFQLENGIPILPFYEGTDYELAALENYLEEIDSCLDVRQLNKKTFKLHHYSKFFNGEELIEQLYMNNFH